MLAKATRKVEILFLFVLFLSLTALFSFQYENIIGGVLESDDFEMIDAVVIRSESSFTSGGRTASGYYLEIEYSYEINKRQYVSNKYSFASSFYNTRAEAEMISNQYNPGDRITIYVSRENPNLSVVEIEANSNKKLLFTLAFLILVIVIVTFDFRKRWKKEDRNKVGKKTRSKSRAR